MASDSEKDSLVIKLDKLRDAIGNDDYEKVNEYAYQVFTDSLAMTDGKSPIELTIKAIYDIINLNQTIEQEIPGIVSNDKYFHKLRKDVRNICDFVIALANGDLSYNLSIKGYLAGTLKMLQSRLKHLAWQTQMVSRGDFTQRVQFMGEFADSFNLMTKQLDQTHKEQAESEKKYRLLAITDPLTGLSNRRHFFEVAFVEFDRSKRYSKPISVIMMDVDHFKKINDNYGHQVGDIIIKSVADRLKTALRGTDIPARYGGEEFIVLLPETAKSDAQAVAERIRENIQSKAIDADGNLMIITASFGVSDYDGAIGYQTLEEVINSADKALYSAKNSGRNRVIVFG